MWGRILAAALAIAAAACVQSTPAREAAMMRDLSARAAIPREPVYAAYRNAFVIGAPAMEAASIIPASLSTAETQVFSCGDGSLLTLRVSPDRARARAIWSDASEVALARTADEAGGRWEGGGASFETAGQRGVWRTQTRETVTVARGDTLGRIARRHYGDAARAYDIAAANAVADPDRIEIGQVLRLPGAGGERRCRRVVVGTTAGPYPR